MSDENEAPPDTPAPPEAIALTEDGLEDVKLGDLQARGRTIDVAGTYRDPTGQLLEAAAGDVAVLWPSGRWAVLSPTAVAELRGQVAITPGVDPFAP